LSSTWVGAFLSPTAQFVRRLRELGGLHSTDRKASIASVWEAIIEHGPLAGDRFAGIPATSPFALSTPMLLPRVRGLGPILPFTFLTARLLEHGSVPDEARSELVPFISTKDLAARDALMLLPRLRTWGSVVKAFVWHRDRKCTFDSEGRTVRRRVLVRESRIAGLGKEANRIGSAQVLGVGQAGAMAKVYVPWAERILALPLSWATEHGIDKRNFVRLRRRFRKGKVAMGYRGGLLERIQSILGRAWVGKPRRDVAVDSGIEMVHDVASLLLPGRVYGSKPPRRIP
jgi:hypothetical protein